MRKLELANIVASGVALLMIAGIEALTAVCFLPVDEHFWPLVAVGYVVLAAFAVWSWTDPAPRVGGKVAQGPTGWREWVGVFFLGLVLSVAFVAFDKAVQHPGLGLAFTAAAVAMTMIALPGAVRAALLEALERQ